MGSEDPMATKTLDRCGGERFFTPAGFDIRKYQISNYYKIYPGSSLFIRSYKFPFMLGFTGEKGDGFYMKCMGKHVYRLYIFNIINLCKK